MSSAHEQRAAQIACWSGGDYRSTAAVLQPAAEVVLDLVGPVAGLRVLDVAAGTGNVAAAAARRGASVTATDLSPRMVELGRARTADAGLAVEWMQADACDLPFDDASFDVVTSTFGLMFATPRPAAVEAARVLRDRGRLALAVWDPDGLSGTLATALEPWMGAPPPGAPHPFDWGRPAVARERLVAHFHDIESTRRDLPWHFASLVALRRFLDRSPPHAMLAAALPEEQVAAMSDAFVAVHRPHVDAEGRVRTTMRYVVITARRNGRTAR